MKSKKAVEGDKKMKISKLQSAINEKEKILKRLEENRLANIKGRSTLTSYSVFVLENRLEYLNLIIARLEKENNRRVKKWI